jgi:hypothetical protein
MGSRGIPLRVSGCSRREHALTRLYSERMSPGTRTRSNIHLGRCGLRITCECLLVPMVLPAVLGLTARDTAAQDLQGEWRAQLLFSSGAFAPIKELEFMYVFYQGRTMTESCRRMASLLCRGCMIFRPGPEFIKQVEIDHSLY